MPRRTKTPPRAPQYDPQQHEEAMYRRWEEANAFRADPASQKMPYGISMPPPNATGHLHMGHAVRMTVQDILIRAARLQGFEALWLPGTDHAAIATESVVIRRLQEKGIADPRRQLGREELINNITQYVEDSRHVIKSQIRRMGASCDWSRERYTMEPALNRIVNEVFVKMYNDGLIYRGMRIVNWDPALQTTVSDDEVERIEEKVPFYYFRYGPFLISTARPETKFGDKYVVMHPQDKRYRQYRHGDTFTCEWINGPVTATIIKDEAVDQEFGTGVMTITPWHDAIDFEIAERHSLDKEQIIDYDGKLLSIAGEFAGMTITDARTNIVNKLRDKGLLVRVEDGYTHSVAVNSRGKGVIEPQIKLQWFVDVNKPAVPWKGKRRSLKEVMQAVVRDGDIKLLPPRYAKLYFHWIDNLRDWCISRQIYWGHRIPVWYRGEEVYVDTRPPAGAAAKAAPASWRQDPDTLDTWFSSALWTFSTLIDRQLSQDYTLSLAELLARSPDYQKFHPTTVLETAYDILFFWVARMILATTYVTGQVPFRHVLLSGLITAKSGKKMSKSDPETIVDPLEAIAEHGADALRFGLAYQLSYGSQAIKFDREAVAVGRNFANKIWNMARLLENLPPRAEPTVADAWIQDELARTTRQLTADLSTYRIGEAAHTLHQFFWSAYADWYLEILKTEGATDIARRVFADALRLLHPFMPHLTELLWETFGDGALLITNTWPAAAVSQSAAAHQKTMQRLQDIVSTVRGARSLFSLKPTEIITVYAPGALPLPTAAAALARARFIDRPQAGMQQLPLGNGGLLHLHAPSLTPQAVSAALNKLTREAESLARRIDSFTRMLAAMDDQAPAKVRAQKEAQLSAARQRLTAVQASRRLLSDPAR